MTTNELNFYQIGMLDASDADAICTPERYTLWPAHVVAYCEGFLLVDPTSETANAFVGNRAYFDSDYDAEEIPGVAEASPYAI